MFFKEFINVFLKTHHIFKEADNSEIVKGSHIILLSCTYKDNI